MAVLNFAQKSMIFANLFTFVMNSLPLTIGNQMVSLKQQSKMRKLCSKNAN